MSKKLQVFEYIIFIFVISAIVTLFQQILHNFSNQQPLTVLEQSSVLPIETKPQKNTSNFTSNTNSLVTEAPKCHRMLNDFLFKNQLKFTFNNFGKTSTPIQNLRMMEINSLNLFESVRYIIKDEKGADQTIWRSEKPVFQTEGLAAGINSMNSDVVVMVEVESLVALKQFNSSYLANQYQEFLIEGNDARGIDVGLLVKKNMPFEIEMRTNRDLVLKEEPLFSRDLPVIIFREKSGAESKVKFILLMTHFKSKRPSPTDGDGSNKRLAQADYTRLIIEKLQTEFGIDTPIFLAGDFNNSVPTAPEFSQLRSLPLVDPLDQFPPAQRFTHFYFNPKGQPEFHQLDAFLHTDSPQISITNAQIVPPKDKYGHSLPLPKTYKERESLPSDHMATVIEDRKSVV